MTERISALLKEPMLSAKEDDPVKFMAAINFPCWVSPKLDGIRAVRLENTLTYSRKLIAIPHRFVQTTLGWMDLEGLDGELTVGEPWAEDVYRKTNSGVTTHAGEPDFRFYVFDDINNQNIPFEARHRMLAKRVAYLHGLGYKHVRLVGHYKIHSVEELLAFEEKCLARGYEGVMIRSPDGLYKQGRSTLRQGWLIKMKRFVDAEAVCIGYQELTHNDNEATTNELGRTKRSSHKANKRAGGTLGSLLCRTPEGVEFRVGGGKGLTAARRAELWAIKDQLPGCLVKYSSLPIGVKDAPRHPKYKFIELRSEID